MAKRKARFIEIEPDNSDALNAETLPYSSSLSIKAAIDLMGGSSGIYKSGIDNGESLSIPDNYFMLVCQDYYVDGNCIVDGDLIEI